MHKEKKVREAGVTLAELLVGVAIIAVLLTLAVPGMTALTESSRLSGATNEFLGSLHLARSEAIKRRTRTVLCPSLNGASCKHEAHWHAGWIVFEDANNNALVDNDEAVIQVRHALPAGMRLTGNPPVSDFISYTATGRTKRTTGAFQAGTLTVCNASSSNMLARRIVISSSGRPRTQKIELATCP